MMRSISWAVMALAFAFGAAGCSSRGEATPESPPAAAVVPGSHADWCDEHAVPESQCTRCNAELIPAFKATQDWCDEHGLPESQCLACNPSLRIVRPPAARAN